MIFVQYIIDLTLANNCSTNISIDGAVRPAQTEYENGYSHH